MGLSDLLTTLRASWRLILLALVLCVGGAVVQTSRTVPQYAATARLYVAAQAGLNTVDQAYTGGLLSQQRVTSYASIIATDGVVSAAIQSLGLGLSVEDVESRISVSSPPNTVLLDVSVTDHDPTRAQALATAVAKSFASYASQLETSGGSRTSPVQVSLVQAAKLPGAAISPNPKRNIALGVLAGLVLGVGGAVLRRSLDRTVRRMEDLQQLGLPTLGAVPEDKAARRQPILGPESGQTPRAEAYRQMRTNLLFLNVDDPVQSLVVTSAVAQEGKSSTTANLGLTFAQAGLSVVVVEADLRRPKLAEYLGVPGDAGLTDVLIGAASLDDVLQPWRGGLMSVLPSGPLPLNPSELLNSHRAADLIAELESRFDIVLIDSPPLLPVTDAAVLAAGTSGAVLVARAGRSRREHLRTAAATLRNVDARLSGVVLNRSARRGRDAYASYYDVQPKRRREDVALHSG